MINIDFLCNNDGSKENHSFNFGVEGPTQNISINELRNRQKEIFLLLYFYRTPMLLSGDEIGKTQNGNNNAYCQYNELSWLN